ncbi:MAG: AraC family ligand binding domain-containing protein, partial [Clostridia bacterium]|nr:AraC family ligand binding domain-containing protein [Clostridia bacterium]
MIDFESHRSGNSYIHFQFCDYMDSNVNIHNSFEFIYICHGHYNLYINAKKYEMKDDTCALILPGQIHHIETVEPFDSPNYKNPQKPFLCFFSADTVKEFSYYIQNFA